MAVNKSREETLSRIFEGLSKVGISATEKDGTLTCSFRPLGQSGEQVFSGDIATLDYIADEFRKRTSIAGETLDFTIAEDPNLRSYSTAYPQFGIESKRLQEVDLKTPLTPENESLLTKLEAYHGMAQKICKQLETLGLSGYIRFEDGHAVVTTNQMTRDDARELQANILGGEFDRDTKKFGDFSYKGDRGDVSRIGDRETNIYALKIRIPYDPMQFGELHKNLSAVATARQAGNEMLAEVAAVVNAKPYENLANKMNALLFDMGVNAKVEYGVQGKIKLNASLTAEQAKELATKLNDVLNGTSEERRQQPYPRTSSLSEVTSRNESLGASTASANASQQTTHDIRITFMDSFEDYKIRSTTAENMDASIAAATHRFNSNPEMFKISSSKLRS